MLNSFIVVGVNIEVSNMLVTNQVDFKNLERPIGPDKERKRRAVMED